MSSRSLAEKGVPRDVDDVESLGLCPFLDGLRLVGGDGNLVLLVAAHRAPRRLYFGDLVLGNAKGQQDAARHHAVAVPRHVHAVDSELVPLPFRRVGLEKRLHVGVEVGKGEVAGRRLGAEKVVVRDELFVVGVVGVFADHRGRQHDDLHAGLRASVEDVGDVGAVVGQGHAVCAMPDIVHAAGEGHELRLLVEDVALETAFHLRGFVARDPCRNLNGGDAGHLKSLHDEVDVADRLGVAKLRDRISEEGDLFALLDERFPAA